VLTDNYRFCRSLEDVVSAEIASLSGLEADNSGTAASSSVQQQSAKKYRSRAASAEDISSNSSSYSTSPAAKPTRSSFARSQFQSQSQSQSQSHKGVLSPIFHRSRDASDLSVDIEVDVEVDADQDIESRLSRSMGYLAPNASQQNRHGGIDSFSSSTDSYALKTVKVRILGKFLGLLHFWPHWTFGVASGMTGPLADFSEAMAKRRGAIRPAALPLRGILKRAWTTGRLSLCVPWIVEFLKMMAWDSYSHLKTNPYREVLGLLRSIQRSDLFHPSKGKLSGNRYLIITWTTELF
jgi:hypothetical protein